MGQFREVSSCGAPEESARKVPKASAYKDGSVGVDVGVHYCHCRPATLDVHPPTLPKREVLTFGQFREVSSAGGVGRKFEERAAYLLRFHGRYAEAGIDHQRSVQGSFFRRGRRKKVRGKAQHTEPVSPPVMLSPLSVTTPPVMESTPDKR